MGGYGWREAGSSAQEWQAITDPDYTRRYFHRTAIESTFEPGAGYRYLLPDGRGAIDGTIEEVETERRLVMTWHTLYDAALAEEPVSRVEWTLRPANDDATVTRVTLRQDRSARPPSRIPSSPQSLAWKRAVAGQGQRSPARPQHH